MWVALGSIYPIRIPQAECEGAATPREELIEVIYNDAVEYYEEREKVWAANNPELPRDLERWITLQVTDTRWREHLDNMDYMRQGIGLRGYAQKDPLVEYRQRGAGDVRRDELPDQAGGRARADARRGGGRQPAPATAPSRSRRRRAATSPTGTRTRPRWRRSRPGRTRATRRST